MKSNCCQAKMDVAGHTTKYYTCMKCNEPCDPWQCIRCNKLLDESIPVHTCTPSRQYRSGIVEGLKIALDHTDDENIECDAQEWLQYRVRTRLQKLIKQYSGDE